jgi:hypothetical protein
MHNIILYPVTMNIHMSKSCTHSHLDLPQVPSLWTGCAVVTQHLEQEPSRRKCGKLTICRWFLQGNHGFSTSFWGSLPWATESTLGGHFGYIHPLDYQFFILNGYRQTMTAANSQIFRTPTRQSRHLNALSRLSLRSRILRVWLVWLGAFATNRDSKGGSHEHH